MNLRLKIILCNIITILVALIGTSILVVSNMVNVRDLVAKNDTSMGAQIEEVASETLSTELQNHTNDTATHYARIFDEELVTFGDDVKILAGAATELYSNQDKYGNAPLNNPDAALNGELSVQFLHSANTDINSANAVRERGLLGNLAPVIAQIPSQNDHIVSSYVASKTGLMIQADYIAGSKFDESGNILPYEASERPWYVGAKEAMDIYYTPVSVDAHGTGVGIMCGVPIYNNGEFQGVAGSGMYLHKMEDTINSLTIGASGYACVLNSNGEIIFSSKKGGLLGQNGTNTESIHNSGNTELSSLVESALKQHTANNFIEIDGSRQYVAAALMPTLNWVFLAAVPESEYQEPIDSLKGFISKNTEASMNSSNEKINQTMLSIMVFGLIVFILCLIISVYTGSTIIRPIRLLTQKINESDGDNLDFKWDLNTKDETAVLGKSFEEMTVKMKQYIENLTLVTAEKERIGAELNVATQIQEDMLPRIFPAFPDIEAIDIYATMDPAKEVGGDFYDFFKIDDNHIALVIADVSGKGVPAALFMVISKTLVKNQSLLSNKKPSEILAKVNNQLCENNEASLFCTCWIGILNIETGHMDCASAGHELPAIKAEDGKFELIHDPHGAPLAALEDLKYTDYEINLSPGQTLYVYTDGVPEATDSNNELFGMERMVDALNIEPNASPKQLLKNVRDSIDEFVGDAPQFDDITMLCLHYKGIEKKDAEGENMIVKEIEVEAKLDNFSGVLSQIEEILSETNCPQDMLYQLNICFEEIFVNIANYAYTNGTGDGMVRILIEIQKEPYKVLIKFRDTGIKYNPLEKEDPDTTLNAEERPIGGLGIFFVKNMMDEVIYEYKNGENILSITKEQALDETI